MRVFVDLTGDVVRRLQFNSAAVLAHQVRGHQIRARARKQRQTTYEIAQWRGHSRLISFRGVAQAFGPNTRNSKAVTANAGGSLVTFCHKPDGSLTGFEIHSQWLLQAWDRRLTYLDRVNGAGRTGARLVLTKGRARVTVAQICTSGRPDVETPSGQRERRDASAQRANWAPRHDV